MNIVNKLILKKINMLYTDGLLKGKIMPFNDDYYKELSGTIYNTIPVDIDIKYLMPKFKPGKCYDRSLKMFFAMDNSVLVRGSLNYFRIQGDTEGVNHGWVERYGFVYDPTFRAIFEKDYYYHMFSVSNVETITVDEYREQNGKYYDDIKNTTIDDFKIGGSKRIDLVLTIPLLEGIAKSDPEFKARLDEYLTEIEYDEQQVSNHIDDLINKSLGI